MKALVAGQDSPDLIAVYEYAVQTLDLHEIDVAWTSIHKERLRKRYDGIADNNAYLLALEFLLEKS